MRTITQSLGWVLAHRTWPVGYCLSYVRSAFGVPAKYPSAISAWNHAAHRHSSAPPRGVPVFFSGGNYGHVAYSAGAGKVYSTDAPIRGRVGLVDIDWFHRNWNYTLLGWTEDINDVRVWVAPVKPSFDASVVAAAARSSKAVKHGTLLKRALAAEVGRGTMVMSSDVLGPGFRRQYKRLQRRWYPNSYADGIPGFISLTRLGKLRGFTVTR